jgi:hypothetical protein
VPLLSRSFYLLATVLFFAGGAGAADYPFSARVTLARAATQRCLRAAGGPEDCSVAEQVRSAFSETAAKMFTPGPDAKLVIELTVTGAEVFEGVGGGLQYDLRVDARVFPPGGALIEELRSIARVSVTVDTNTANAAAAAARKAAADFADAFDNSPIIRQALVNTGLLRPADLGPSARGEKLFWFSLGAGLAQGGGDGGLGFAGSLRAGATVKWLVVQLTYAHLRTSFQGTANALPFDTGLDINDLGLEAGAVFHLTPDVELHAGPGLHFLIAEAEGSNPTRFVPFDDQSQTATKLVPAAFASLSVSFYPFRNGSRLLLGVETRGYFSSTLDFQDFNRRIPAANASFGVFFGSEIPWGWKGAAR